MGDMIRCPRCGTWHYRNDPCPDYVIKCPECLLWHDRHGPCPYDEPEEMEQEDFSDAAAEDIQDRQTANG
jgi:hypothetical protein